MAIGNPYKPGSANYAARQAYINQTSTPAPTVTSKPTVVTGTGGSRTVNLPSNFASLPVREKLDILSGKKDEEAKQKASEASAKERLISYSRGGGVRLPDNLAPFVDNTTGQVNTQRAAASVQQKPTGGVVNVGGTGLSNFANTNQPTDIQTGQASKSIQTMSDKEFYDYVRVKDFEGIDPSDLSSSQKKVWNKAVQEKSMYPQLWRQNTGQYGLEQQSADLAVFGTLGAPFLLPLGGAAAIAGGILGGYGIIEGSKIYARKSGGQPVDMKTELSIAKNVEARIQEDYSKRGMQIPLVGSTDNLLYGLPGSTVVGMAFGSDAGNLYKQYATEEATKMGYKGEVAKNIGNYMQGIKGYSSLGEIGSLFPVGAIGEIGVSQAVNQGLKQAGVYATKKEAAEQVGNIAFRGAIIPSVFEGMGLYATQNYARGTDVTPEGLILSGALSGVTGGYGAKWIAKNSITRPRLTNVVYKASWIGQWDEPAGDITKNILFRASGQQTDNIVKFYTPTVSVTPSFSTSNQQSTPNVNIKTPGSATQGISNNDIFDFSKGQSFSDTFGQSQSDSGSKSDSSSNTGTETKGDSVTNTFSDTFTNTYNNSYTNTASDTSTDTYTNTFTNTFTNTTTQTFSGNLPFVPLGLPFSFDFGGGGSGGGRGRGRTKYFNELASAKSLFGSFDSGFVPPVTRRPSVTRNKKSYNPTFVGFNPFNSNASVGFNPGKMDFSNVFKPMKGSKKKSKKSKGFNPMQYW